MWGDDGHVSRHNTACNVSGDDGRVSRHNTACNVSALSGDDGHVRLIPCVTVRFIVGTIIKAVFRVLPCDDTIVGTVIKAVIDYAILDQPSQLVTADY